ncbi:MAG TPA: tetratricopeptide repeat protein, partial [Dehalococcoidia bacterium]
SERARLFGAITTFLKNASQERPLVVFLDDLHWSDRPSLLLLEFVARNVADQCVMIVGTYRDVEVGREHPLAQALAALRRMEHHERIEVAGLPRNEIDDLLEAIEPSEESRPVRRVLSAVLARQTEGNPLFVREVITTLIESGKIVHEDGRWTSHVTSVDELAIPAGVKEAVGRRLARLSEGCSQMLTRACVFTSGFMWEELVSVCDESEDELLDYLDEALGAQLIAERERGRFVFTHGLVRATLYDELSTPRRVRLHRRVAESLENLYGDDIDAHLTTLAAHYMASAGGDMEKAILYSIRAGNRAMELVAWEEAAVHFQRSVDAIPESGGEERRCRVLLDLGQALSYAGQYTGAVDAYRQAAEAARVIASPELLGEAACGFEDAGYMTDDPTLPSRRLALIDEALSSLDTGDSALRALLLAQRTRASLAGGEDALRTGGAGSLLGQKDPVVLAQAREAVAIGERIGDPAVTAMALNCLSQYLLGPGSLDEQREIAERCVMVARQAGALRIEMDGWQWVFAAALRQGDMRVAREAHDEAARLAGESKIGWGLWGEMQRGVALALAAGQLAEAEAAVFEALNFGQGIGHASALQTFGAQLYALRWYQGRLGEIEGMFRGLVSQSPNIDGYQVGLINILAETAQLEEATQMLDVIAARGFTSIPEDLAWSIAVVVLADACQSLNYRDGAAELYEVVLQHPDESATSGTGLSLGAIGRSLGQLATVLGRWDDAERHFDDALDLNRKMDHRPALAQTRLNYGEMLLRRVGPGDGEKAQILLRQALEAAQEMGMATVAADCERLLGTAETK